MVTAVLIESSAFSIKMIYFRDIIMSVSKYNRKILDMYARNNEIYSDHYPRTILITFLNKFYTKKD